jgi:hypothetical protein
VGDVAGLTLGEFIAAGYEYAKLQPGSRTTDEDYDRIMEKFNQLDYDWIKRED